MQFRPINPTNPIFYFACNACGNRTASNNGLADIDGPAFRAFYCIDCANKSGKATS